MNDQFKVPAISETMGLYILECKATRPQGSLWSLFQDKVYGDTVDCGLVEASVWMNLKNKLLKLPI